MKLRTNLSNLNKGTLTPVQQNIFSESKEYLSKPIRQTDATDRAVSFYIVNKCSFSGLTESSSFSKQASDSNFSMRGIENSPTILSGGLTHR